MKMEKTILTIIDEYGDVDWKIDYMKLKPLLTKKKTNPQNK